MKISYKTELKLVGNNVLGTMRVVPKVRGGEGTITAYSAIVKIIHDL